MEASIAQEKPVGRQLLETLDAFANTTQSLLATLSVAPGPNATLSAAPSAPHIARLIELDAELDRLSSATDRHLKSHARISALVEQIRTRDQQWREDMREAEKTRRSLDELVERGRKDRQAIEKASQAPFTSLPPHAHPADGQPLDLRLLTQQPGVQLPYPTEEVLKRGWLGQADQLGGVAGQGDLRDAGMEAPKTETGAAAPTRSAARAMPVVQQPEEFEFDLDLN